jgi:hypothetical protein
MKTKIFKTKMFRLCLYEGDSFITIQKRVCFFWITLYGDDNEIMRFKNFLQAEEYLSKEKKFGEIFIIDYRKITY